MPPDTPLADCRARLAFDLLANTWNPVVLWSLRDGPHRPSDLRRRIGGISSKVLTETLRRLTTDGLVTRSAPTPSRVSYALTDLGRTLLPAIETMGTWAAAHGDEVLTAREEACVRARRRRDPYPG